MNTAVFTPARMNQAFAKVRRNSDCAGTDGLTPTVYSIDLNARLGALQRAIENRSYQPQPLRANALNLPGKKSRTLCVPTVDDRIAQTAAAQVLTPEFEARFADFSYGYRPARSVPLALEALTKRARDPDFVLEFAKRLVAGKIANARTVLKRYARERGSGAIQVHERALIQMSAHVARAPTLDVLRGCEGFAAKSYFAALRVWLPPAWGFTERATRPPPDPFKALLSFGYTLLMQNVGSFIQAAVGRRTGAARVCRACIT